jgi:transposase
MTHAIEVSPRSTTSSEAVDDIPLLIAHIQRVGIQRLIDAHFPSPAGGLSLGWVAVLWLAHILSQSGRHIPHLRAWVASHPETLQWLIAQPVRQIDISEGRLRDLLRVLDDDAIWPTFEAALNQHILRVHRLQPERVRLTHSVGLWYITADGTLQFDQSRRWWPGALQVQITLATLDPIGLPAMVWMEPALSLSNGATEPMLNAIRQTRVALPNRSIVFIGNSEISPVHVRAAIHEGNDTYLYLLPPEEALNELQRVVGDAIPVETDANTYEYSQSVCVEQDDRRIEWTERHVLVRSHRQTHDQESELMGRIARAQRELLGLNERKRGKRRPQTMAAMHDAVDGILAEYGVTGLITPHFDEMVDERTVRRYRGRPTTTRVARLVTVSSSVNEAALISARERLGWQVYVTTLSAEALPIDQAVRMYSEPEHVFERMRGRPLSLLPGVIQRTDHIRGLVRFLTIGLRCMKLLDSTARAHAAHLPNSLWQRPGSAMQQSVPTGERLLEAFRDITLTTFSEGQEQHAHLTALSAVQRRVLELLVLSPMTYHVG